MAANRIEWTVLEHDGWKLHLAKTERGLCYIGSPGAAFEEMEAHVRKRFPLAEFIESADALLPYLQELKEYFTGTRTFFSLPVDTQGTAFQREVWQALQKIPYGKTVSYSEIAALINRPSAIRAVGTAIGANPVLIAVPCHRVIGKSGAITGYRGGLELKRFLLGLETKV